jgi:hypothetical protein
MAINMLSTAAKRRMMFTFRNCEQLKVMLTLTYPGEFPMDGRLVKRHWHNMRTWLVRQGIKGAWFLEFQKRGAPHFHVFLNGRVEASQVSQRWYEIVGSEDLNHLLAGTRIEMLREQHAACAYAAKYASKVEQKEPPEGFTEVGRFWGTFGDLDVSPVEVYEYMPQEQFVDVATGQVVPNPGVQTARFARRLMSVHRKARGLRPFRDNGRTGFTAYNVSEPAMVFFHWYSSRVVSIGKSRANKEKRPGGSG